MIQAVGYELGKALVYIGIGFLFGYIVRGYKEKYTSTIENEKIISLMILFVYVVSILSAILNPNYQTPAGLHGIMGIVAGYYFKQILKK